MKKGVLAIISGFSGAGKGTVIKELLARHEGYVLSISATTRAPRPSEKDGVDYHFTTRDAFEKMIRENGFLENAVYGNDYYGTPRAFVETNLEEGRHVLLEIDLQGARQICEKYPDAVRIFMTPPSIEELEKRLRGRGSEDEEAIRRRLSRAKVEAQAMGEYDYILVNDEVVPCAEKLHTILQASRMGLNRNLDLVREIQADAARIDL
ncbi:MAG: guanylate kinase [Blautia sp.]|nr:guanylate kinase [Blautia sp.]